MSFYDSVLLISHFLKEFPQISPPSKMRPLTSSHVLADSFFLYRMLFAITTLSPSPVQCHVFCGCCY